MVGEALQSKAPGTVLTGPTTAGIDFDFIETVFARGGLKYLSAVSVHPYRPIPPESACYDYATLRQMIANYSSAPVEVSQADAGRNAWQAFPPGAPSTNVAGAAHARLSPPTPAGVPPVLSSEWGYTTCHDPAGCTPSNPISVSEMQQAAVLQRRFIMDALCGIPMSIDYEWRDGGNTGSDKEQNFGGVYHDPTGNASKPFKPKPKYLAAVTYKKLVGSLTLQGRVVATVEPTKHGSSSGSSPGSLVDPSPTGNDALQLNAPVSASPPEAPNATFIAEFASPSEHDGSAASAPSSARSLVYSAWTLGSQAYCASMPAHRDCGFYAINEDECLQRGCCYVPNKDDKPWCQWPIGAGSVVATFEADEASTGQGACFDRLSWNGTVEGEVCGGGASGRQLTVEVSSTPLFLALK